MILDDLRKVICTTCHIYDCKTKTWHTNVSVTSDLFKELQNKEVIGIRDIHALPSHIMRNTHDKGIVISII